MNLIPSNANMEITFQRRKSSICLCFAMMINKSQGQILSNVRLYLSRSIFTHGQLYVVLSRVKMRWGLKILIIDYNGQPLTLTTNVLYEEVFQKI